MSKLVLSYYPYNLQLKYPFTISNYSRTTTPVVLTELRYEDRVGYGEASLPQYLGETQQSVIDFLNKVDLTRFAYPFDIDDILSYTDCIESGNTAAKASVDIALHDLIGKMAGIPLYKLWGSDKNDTPYSSYTIGMDSDDVIRMKVSEVADDFKILKVKLGGKDDLHTVDVVRSVTDLPLAVDANQGWTDRAYALDMICRLEEKGVILIEQPMGKHDLDGNAWLTEHSPLPVYADESVQRLSDMQRLKGVFSGINIKLMKCTGLNEARKMISLASEWDLSVMLGCMTETSCAISAAAQLSPAVGFADLDGALLITNDCFSGMKIKKGKIELNDSPGIGVELLK